MATAIRIQTLDNLSAVIATLNFAQMEVQNCRVQPGGVRGVTKRAQTGAPTFFVVSGSASSLYHQIKAEFYVQGDSTLGKLTTLRDHVLGGGIVRVYPKFTADPSIFYDCFFDPSILTHSIFSGEAKKGDKLKVEFNETDMTSQVTVSNDVIIV